MLQHRLCVTILPPPHASPCIHDEYVLTLCTHTYLPVCLQLVASWGLP
jgi:hypothetical protein